MDKLYIIIPAYNEQETIKDVVQSWYPIVEKAGEGSRLVIIDDGSKDETFSIVSNLAESMPQLEIKRKENGGHGAAVLYGYNYALEQGADYIFQTDSDGQTDPGEFARFWELRESYDLIIGHRHKREDGFSRIIVTKTLKLVLRLCFGETVTDANTPFRLMNRRSLAENIVYVPKDFNLSNVILTIIYTKRRQRIKYIPISFRPRQGGVNSINLKKIFRIGVRALKDFRQINSNLKEMDDGKNN